jgi:hypothetical protein
MHPETTIYKWMSVSWRHVLVGTTVRILRQICPGLEPEEDAKFGAKLRWFRELSRGDLAEDLVYGVRQSAHPPTRSRIKSIVTFL